MRRESRFAAAALAALLTACGDSPMSPGDVQAPEGTHQSVFSPVTGPGAGGVSVTPISNAAGSFEAVIRIRLQGGRPATTYTVQRAPEIGRANGADGVCQRALGQAPWSASDPPALAFLTFTQPGSAMPMTFTTQPNGNGSLDFQFAAPTIPAGTMFDVMFRLVDDAAAPATELRSGCFTVVAR
jgi:hypothetical protein